MRLVYSRVNKDYLYRMNEPAEMEYLLFYV
jgi:hypothetical protein